LQAQIDDFHDKTTSFHEKTSVAPLTSEQSENLSALGYVSSSAAGASQDPFQAPTRKDKIGISNILQDGMIAIEDGRYEEAIPLLNMFWKTAPGDRGSTATGIALSKVQRYAEAIVSLRKAVEQLPDSVQAQYELGLALYETGAWRDSVPYSNLSRRSVLNGPTHNILWLRCTLAPSMCLKLWSCCSQWVQLNPQHFRANLLLGRILTLQTSLRGGPAVPQAGGKIRAG